MRDRTASIWSNCNTNVNQIPDSFINQAPRRKLPAQPVTIAQPVAAYPFNQVLPGNVGSQHRAGPARPAFPAVFRSATNGQGCCSSNYNSLQATVNKRFPGGGTLLVAYTNAKLLSNTDTLTSWLEGGVTGGVGAVQDWNNLAGERSLSSQDVSQRLVISYVLDLPFGRGKKYLGGVNGVAGKLVSGWGLDGVTTFQRGFPVKISYGQGSPLSALGLGIGTSAARCGAGCDKCTSGSRLQGWASGSTRPASLLPATMPSETKSRVDPTLRQHGINNFDFAIFKKTTIAEWANIEFRTEFFNLFNHPQFGPPNGTCCIAPPNGTFGDVTNTIGNASALIQFALKFEF